MISKALIGEAYHGKLRELARSGVDLTVVVPPGWGKQKREQVRPEGYELLELDCIFSGAHHFHFYPGISSVIDMEAWDLVHIDEEPFNFVTYHALHACLRRRSKVVFFTWQNIAKTYPPPFNYFEGFSHKHVQGAIAGTEEVRDVLRARKFLKPIVVIPQFGVDPELFQRRDVSALKEKLGIAGKFAIGYVGRMVKEKGVADLIHALVALPESCRLVLVGSGEIKLQLQELAGKLGVAAKIHWVPQISSLEVPDYMNALDVLVLPSHTTSRWKEQFGRVLIEAMACETPVVGSSSAEIPKVIGEAGLVFPEGDVDSLASRLGSLYENPEARAALGTKGRERVLARFTNRRIAEETTEFYRTVLVGPAALEPAA